MIVSALLSSCNNAPEKSTKVTPEITKGEECSVIVSGVEFKKSLNGAIAAAAVEGEKLILKSNAKCDNFNDPDGKLSNNTAPVLLTDVDNTRPFTFTARITPTFNDTYDAGTMYIYQNPKLWFKFACSGDIGGKVLCQAVSGLCNATPLTVTTSEKLSLFWTDIYKEKE